MDSYELANRFAHHPPSTPAIATAHTQVREHMQVTASMFNILLPEGREKALVMTHLEEAMFWANAAISRTQKRGDQ